MSTINAKDDAAFWRAVAETAETKRLRDKLAGAKRLATDLVKVECRREGIDEYSERLLVSAVERASKEGWYSVASDASGSGRKNPSTNTIEISGGNKASSCSARLTPTIPPPAITMSTFASIAQAAISASISLVVFGAQDVITSQPSSVTSTSSSIRIPMPRHFFATLRSSAGI